MPEQDVDIGQLEHALQDDVRRLELLTLDHEWIFRVILQKIEIEGRDQFSGHAVPELEGRRGEADRGHILDEACRAEHFQGGGMGRCGARIGQQFVVHIKHGDGNTRTAEQQCAEQADRASACDQNSLVGLHGKCPHGKRAHMLRIRFSRKSRICARIACSAPSAS